MTSALRSAFSCSVLAGDAGGRSSPGRPGGVAALGAASCGRAGAGGATPRGAGAHHAEERLRRRDDRGRHGPAVAVVSSATRECWPRRARGEGAWRRWHLARHPRTARGRPAGGRPFLAPLGAAPGAHLRGGRPRLPQVPRADEAARHDGRPGNVARYLARWARRRRCPPARRGAAPRTGRAIERTPRSRVGSEVPRTLTLDQRKFSTSIRSDSSCSWETRSHRPPEATLRAGPARRGG